MNHLANTHLATVDRLLAIHRGARTTSDWEMILGNLADAVRAMNEGKSSPDPCVFRHDWTPEELAQREKMLKPLTLDELQSQVDAAVEELDLFNLKYGMSVNTALPDMLPIGDFEIRRRK